MNPLISKQNFLAATILFAFSMVVPCIVHADHALESKGTGLFNVIVEDNVPTGTKNMRVRFTDTSFALTYKTKTLRPLLGRADYFIIEDHITTASRVGKESAIKIMEDRKWSKYDPAPKPTPKPVTTASLESKTTYDINTPIGKIENTFNKAFMIPKDNTLNEEQQITNQLNAFIQQQQMLTTQLNTYVRNGMVTVQQATQTRKNILETQLNAFKEAYKQDTDSFAKALKFFEVQQKSLNERGFYNYE